MSLSHTDLCLTENFEMSRPTGAVCGPVATVTGVWCVFVDYTKGSLSSTCSLNSENPYATINDPPGMSKHSESSYVEMKSPAHRDHVTPCCPAGATPSRNVYDVGAWGGVPARCSLLTA